MPAVLQRPHPFAAELARPDHKRSEALGADLDRPLAHQFARRRRNSGDRVRALVGVRTEHDHDLVHLPLRYEWTPGGHRLLGALPRSYQVTPDIPDRRRATQRKPVRPNGRQRESESARRRSDPPSAAGRHRPHPNSKRELGTLAGIRSAPAADDEEASGATGRALDRLLLRGQCGRLEDLPRRAALRPESGLKPD
jgi:hypothetical protein